MDLTGKKVLITGGACRVGRVIAETFADKKAEVLIHYHRSGREADRLLKSLRKRGVRAESYQADLQSPSAIRRMVRRILKRHGSVDVLVHSASVFYPTPFKRISDQNWDHFFQLHIKAPFLLAQLLGPVMKKKGSGRIIHIADGGHRPMTAYIPYCVTKAGLLSLTQGLAKVLAPEVLVTAVCPGPVLAPAGMSGSEKKKITRHSLLKRWGTPKDVAKMAVFLAEQDFVTGSAHWVDGGGSLRG